jgi:hypothetical protein
MSFLAIPMHHFFVSSSDVSPDWVSVEATTRKFVGRSSVYCETNKLEIILLGKKKKGKAVPLHAMEALGWRGDIAPTHY